MKSIQILFILGFLFLVCFSTACYRAKDSEAAIPEKEDTTTKVFVERGLLLDTRTTNGLSNAKVSLYAIVSNTLDTLVSTTTTDSNGFFKFKFVYRTRNWGFHYVFEHPNSVFMKRTYKSDYNQEKINDSTYLFYLHRKSACRIALKNLNGQQKNVMLFNTNQQLSKLLMNMRNDTTIYYLLQDYKDIIYFDYFPQKSLQQIPVTGSTSGDTLNIEFKY